MSDNNALAHEGLFTRWGMEITAIHRFGHAWVDGDEFWRKHGTWWAVCDLRDPKSRDTMDSREIELSRIVYDSGSAEGAENMESLSKACMEYLDNNGTFDGSLWMPH